MLNRNARPLLVIGLMVVAAGAFGADNGVFDDVLAGYRAAVAGWEVTLAGFAKSLFWKLALITLAATCIFSMIRQEGWDGLFPKLVQWIIVTGFFFWLITLGVTFTTAIFESFMKVAETVTGQRSLSPTALIDLGFDLVYRTWQNTSLFSPVESAVQLIMVAAVLLVIALIAANMLVYVVLAWVAMYGGQILLAFGGTSFTSNIAVNYYRSVIGMSVRVYAMALCIGIGLNIINQFYGKLGPTLTFHQHATMLFMVVFLYVLIKALPAALVDMIHGGINSGVGNAGAATVLQGATWGKRQFDSWRANRAASKADSPSASKPGAAANEEAGPPDSVGGTGDLRPPAAAQRAADHANRVNANKRNRGGNP